MYDMYVPVLCVLSICPHLIIYVLTFYLLLLSLLLCPPPRGRWTLKFADATELMYLCQCFIIVLLNRYTHVPLFFPHLIISPSSSLFTVRRIKAQQQSIILIKR